MNKQRAFHNTMQTRQFYVERVLTHQLANEIVQGTSWKEAKGFPFAFLTSIPVGADLSLVLARFMVWLLVDPERGVLALWASRVSPLPTWPPSTSV